MSFKRDDFICLLIPILLGIYIALKLHSSDILYYENTKRAESLLNDENLELYQKLYEYIDRDTGYHYLVHLNKDGSIEEDGIEPRYNPDGTIMISE